MTQPQSLAADGALQPALTALHDAISALIDPQPVRLDMGKLTWLDPPLQELRDALGGTNMAGRCGGRDTMLPLWADVYDLAVKIDRRVSAFWPAHSAKHDDPTTARLMVIADHGWRPQDVDALTGFTADLVGFKAAIVALLLPEPVLLLGKPCPKCGADRIKRRDNAGELVNTRALTVRADGVASCAVCRCRWSGITQLRVLGQMIGYGRPSVEGS